MMITRDKCLFTSQWLMVMVVMMFTLTPCRSQKFLQLEMINHPESKRFYIGEEIEIKIKQQPKDWTRRKIVNFFVEDRVILFEDGYVPLDDIIYVRTYRPWAKVIGEKLIQGSVMWFAYGGVAAIFWGAGFGPGTVILGLSAAGTGWLIKKLFYKRVHKMGNRYRLRLMDISFFPAQGRIP